MQIKLFNLKNKSKKFIKVI